MTYMRFVGGVTIIGLALASCGDPDAEVPLDAPPSALTCDDDLAEIVEFLKVGAPLYDYDPATDLTDLTDRASVVVAGSIDRLVRGADGQTIFFESGDLRHVGPTDAAAPASGFDMDWVWADRTIPDPMVEPLDLVGVEVVAFLHRRGDGSGSYSPDPQGIHVGCVGSDAPATNVLDQVPDDVVGASVDGLVSAVESIFGETAGSSTVPLTDEEFGATATPLHQQRPTVALGVDGTPLVELVLGFETWDGQTADPPEPAPAVGVTVSELGSLTFAIEHPALATITFFRLDEQLRFVRDAVIPWDGTSVVTPAPRNGTWFVDVRAEFGPSGDYAGEGVLRAGTWLQVVPADSSCTAPHAAPANSPDAAVTGVIDGEGCPVRADVATLDLDVLTPWYHCAPWPPSLRWRVGDAVAMTQFWPYVDDPSDVEIVGLPDDAEATGRFLPSGEILAAASDPDALFVQSENGSTQRWSVPDETLGCA